MSFTLVLYLYNRYIYVHSLTHMRGKEVEESLPCALLHELTSVRTTVRPD